MKPAVDVPKLIQTFIVKNPERSAEKDFAKGG